MFFLCYFLLSYQAAHNSQFVHQSWSNTNSAECPATEASGAFGGQGSEWRHHELCAMAPRRRDGALEGRKPVGRPDASGSLCGRPHSHQGRRDHRKTAQDQHRVAGSTDAAGWEHTQPGEDTECQSRIDRWHGQQTGQIETVIASYHRKL